MLTQHRKPCREAIGNYCDHCAGPTAYEPLQHLPCPLCPVRPRHVMLGVSFCPPVDLCFLQLEISALSFSTAQAFLLQHTVMRLTLTPHARTPTDL
ncbi:hypothetical protein AOLI_G00123650 [Acnodon oligacanthus]